MSDASSPQLVADRYRLLSPLGQGGMGRVWKARDEVLHRDVAIKELVAPPGLTADERREMRERSLREARAIARLNNINVVRIFDVLRTDGDPWIVMEYVASRSLQDTLAADGPVPAARAVEIGLGVLNALKAAHKAGIMHRDVKPGNVLLGDDGRVVLTDFGLATIPGDPNVTRTGMVLGSPAYIAPERARDGTFGPEADLWSLGATLYAAVEGKSPYARPSAIATLAALATEPVPPARNAGPLKQVLAGLLRKDPEERITAESAERMLRKASGRRARGISLLDGVRRPGPNGPREPRPPLVPSPRSAGEPTAKVDGAAPDAGAIPTARVDTPATGSDTASTTKVEAAEAAAPANEQDTPPAADEPRGSATGEKDGDEALSGERADPPAKDVARTVPQGASLLPAAPVSPAPARGSVFKAGQLRSERTRRAVLVGALVALLLVGLVAIVPLLSSGDGGEEETPQGTAGTSGATAPPTSAPAAPPPTSAAPSSPSASPTPSASPSETTAGGLPEGWTLRTDPVGFKVAVPEGWRRSAGGTWVKYRDPDGVSELTIDRTDKPQRDAAAAWRRIEPDRKNVRGVQDYRLIGISPLDCKWRTCADWDWLQKRNGVEIRVRNRGFVTASNRGFALRWEVPNRDWEAQLENFEMIFRDFVPDRQD